MLRQTQDGAGIIPLVCCELLALAFATAAARMARMTDTITARELDALTTVSAMPLGQESAA